MTIMQHHKPALWIDLRKTVDNWRSFAYFFGGPDIRFLWLYGCVLQIECHSKYFRKGDTVDVQMTPDALIIMNKADKPYKIPLGRYYEPTNQEQLNRIVEILEEQENENSWK